MDYNNMGDLTSSLDNWYEIIADRLAEEGYAIIDDAFIPEETARLRAELDRFRREGVFKPAGIGSRAQYQQNSAIRGDQIRWIERTQTSPDIHFFFDRLEGLSHYLNRTLYLGIRSYEFHFAAYPPGAFYKRHLDVFQNTTTRKISVICYLNDAWQPHEGGQLRLYIPNRTGAETAIDVMPAGGRLVCFRSDLLEHEVLPAVRERLSITGWLKNTDERLI